MTIYDLDTPAVLIDLDRVEANLRRWQKFCVHYKIKNRPHVKTHKIPELARMQMRYGAVGITCQKLGEAEAMCDGGVKDIFLTYNIVGELKLERLMALHQRANVRTIVDGKEVADGLNAMASRSGKPLDVLIECDTGMHRIGVQSPLAAAELAEYVSSCDALRFLGFSTYPTSRDSVVFLQEARQLCEAKGIFAEEISGGGTPGMWKLAEFAGLTEYRAGTFIYNDRIIVQEGAASLEDCAMTLLVSVVSDAGDSYVTVDGGTKTFSSDQYGQTGFGVLLTHPNNSLLVRCSEEHGVFQVQGKKPELNIGQKVRIIPNHSCIVSNLHDVAFGVRGEDVVEEWKITARGKLQ